ncbi:putative ubiquitin specific protease 39 isoform 2, partial [Cardiosporidium cionae]
RKSELNHLKAVKFSFVLHIFYFVAVLRNKTVNLMESENQSHGEKASKRQRLNSPPGADDFADDTPIDATEILSQKEIGADTNHSLATPVEGKGQRNCPYLGTINRHLLDFDFEKLCSICLSNQHVYACLVCGKFFQGRGKGTYCYIHSLEERHYVFMNLKNSRVYCLPDNYVVDDASLDDIRHFLNPRYTISDVDKLNSKVVYGKALDGTDFLPGCIGLNNLKRTDYFNVIVQIVCKITPLRNSLLLLDLSLKQNPDVVLLSLGELIRKMYNPKNFKGIVSPHEFLQAVGVASEKKFRIGVQKDPLALFSWLMNRLAIKLKAPRTRDSVVNNCLRGQVFIKISKIEGKEEVDHSEQKLPYLFLSLTPPEAPIFKDSLDRNMIPQSFLHTVNAYFRDLFFKNVQVCSVCYVPIFDLLRKFDGATPQNFRSINFCSLPLINKKNSPYEREFGQGMTKRFFLWTLPPFLVLQINRFSKNNFFVEKNPTIVTFPIKNLDLRDLAGLFKNVHVTARLFSYYNQCYHYILFFWICVLTLFVDIHPDAHELNPVTRYNLVANVCHQGQPQNGIYKVHVLHAPTDEWYEAEDLRVTSVLPQFVALSESYIQVYQRQDVLSDGTLDEELRSNALRNILAQGDLGDTFIEEDDDIFAT